MCQIAIEGKTDIGRRRDENEDAVSWNNGTHQGSFSYLMVADGMGGYQGGATASQTAVRIVSGHLASLQTTFSSYTPDQKTMVVKSELFQAVINANEAILDQKLQNPQLQQMGTTLVVAVIWSGCLMVCHIGDSRAYIWDERRGIRQLTKDHSVVQQMIDSGSLTEEQARTSNIRNQLTRALGVQRSLSPVINTWELTDDSLILLCSDGLTEYFSNHQIGHLLATHKPSLESCYRFIDESNRQGGKDNISVVIGQYETSAAMHPTAMQPTTMQKRPESDATVPKADKTVPYKVAKV
ncbi:Stp1/IreP family PP2C-type Ser/Thr phosphatase [Endozoicomonas lisbonensis]|uniref:Serine/threonine protein phosphatase PrpC n=1 Tax=Endozoicomonas lisbonensis TaxID=3120522 RepID=A0ABV2SAQ4_9GAMM